MSRKKIIILDNSTSEVHIFDYPSDIYGDKGEDFILLHHSEHGLTFTVEDCQWMIVDLDYTEGRLPLYIH